MKKNFMKIALTDSQKFTKNILRRYWTEKCMLHKTIYVQREWFELRTAIYVHVKNFYLRKW